MKDSSLLYFCLWFYEIIEDIFAFMFLLRPELYGADWTQNLISAACVRDLSLIFNHR